MNKRINSKRYIALILALVLAFSMTTFASATSKVEEELPAVVLGTNVLTASCEFQQMGPGEAKLHYYASAAMSITITIGSGTMFFTATPGTHDILYLATPVGVICNAYMGVIGVNGALAHCGPWACKY